MSGPQKGPHVALVERLERAADAQRGARLSATDVGRLMSLLELCEAFESARLQDEACRELGLEYVDGHPDQWLHHLHQAEARHGAAP